MKRIIAGTLVACAGLMAMPVAAHATETVEMSWWMEGSVNGETTWPQPVAAGQCGWFQVDTYYYGTPEQKAIVDALDDDGVLSLINGTPEDSRVYKSHYYKEVPCPTETPTPEPTTTPTPTSTPTSSPSSTPTLPTSPEPTGTPSVTTPTGTTPEPTDSQISTATSNPSTGPGELAATGLKPDGWIVAGILVIAGLFAFFGAKAKRKEDDA